MAVGNPENNTPQQKRSFPLVWKVLLSVTILTTIILALPLLYSLSQQTYTPPIGITEGTFPVTVNPQNKTITEDPQVNALLTGPNSPLQASVGNVSGMFWRLFEWVAVTVDRAPWYQNIAGVIGTQLVIISPGMRREEVASTFAQALSWNTAEKKTFLTPSATSSLPLIEGSFAPGTYAVHTDMTPPEVQGLVNDRFTSDFLSHYGTTTASIVPLEEALTIASLIERETIGTADMRLVSGVIWNRIFAGMKLQIDATLQYAKANTASASNWWPKVKPKDMYRASPYNTYLHTGLPPTPIASPSVAAVLAALNPLSTSCFYYFNDTNGNILCTDTYPEHVKLLKQYYGQGK